MKWTKENTAEVSEYFEKLKLGALACIEANGTVEVEEELRPLSSHLSVRLREKLEFAGQPAPLTEARINELLNELLKAGRETARQVHEDLKSVMAPPRCDLRMR